MNNISRALAFAAGGALLLAGAAGAVAVASPSGVPTVTGDAVTAAHGPVHDMARSIPNNEEEPDENEDTSQDNEL